MMKTTMINKYDDDDDDDDDDDTVDYASQLTAFEICSH